MAQQLISIGTSPNDNSGDPLRTAFTKTNSNFTELYAKAGASNLALINNQLTSQNYNGNIDIVANGSGYITTDSTSQLVVYNTANSTSTTSGAVVVKGGVGIAGSLYIGGTFNAPSASFASLDNTPIGANVASTGTFTTINSVNGTINNFNSYTINATSGGFQSISANVILSNYAEFTSITYTAINNTPVGNSTPSTGAFTWGNIGNLVTANAKITGGTISGVSLSGLTGIDNIPIGATTPNSGVFTNLLVTTGNIRAYFNGAIGANTANTGTFTSVTSTGSATAANLYNSGNLTFSGSGTRIFGDFSNATTSSRVAFQSSTTNGNTGIVAIPNGSSQYSAFTVMGSSDANNVSFAALHADESTTHVGINSGHTGAGTTRDLVMQIDGTTKFSVVASTGGVTAVGPAILNNTLNVAGTSTMAVINAANISGNVITANAVQVKNIGNITPGAATFTEVTINGNLVASNYTITGNISGSASTAGSATTAGTANYASTSGLATNAVNVTSATQANITTVGTLTSLYVTGNINVSSNINVLQDVIMDGNIIASGMTAGKNYTTSNGISSGSYVNLTKTHIINNNSTTATIYGNLYNQLDGQIVTVSTKSAITNFYLVPNVGIAINGNVTSLTAGGYVSYQYIDELQSWFRIG